RLWLTLSLLALTSALLAVSIIQLRREAELARMRADFVSGVSHELRTPLAQIRLFAETLLLGRVRTDVERRRSLEIIANESQRLTHLVENVLSFSKPDRGDGRWPRQRIDVVALARDVVDGFVPLASARQVDIRIVSACP